MSGVIHTSVKCVTFAVDTDNKNVQKNMSLASNPYCDGSIPCLPMSSSAAKEKYEMLKKNSECTASASEWVGGMSPGILDDVIRRLTEVQSARPGKQVHLSQSDIQQPCVASKDIFLQQPNLLELKGPVSICGNINGLFSDLLRLFEHGGFPPSAKYLFVGGYVDYGKQRIETMCLLLAYKIKHPENFFLLRGNHECASINLKHGFYDECKRRFNVRIWKCFNDSFNCLPAAALVDDRILCVHGGPSPDLENLDQIRNLPRPSNVPDTGLLCDLLWSSPCSDVKGWGTNKHSEHIELPFSYLTFGSDKVTEFLMKHDLDLLCCAQQVVECDRGYEFFANSQLVTISSAPNFRSEHNNAGAMMHVDETLMCSFQILKAKVKRSVFNFSPVTRAFQRNP